MAYHYPVPYGVALQLFAAILRRRTLLFRQEAHRAVENLDPPLKIFNPELIPQSGPCLLTANHYSRPGFRAWWFVLAISAAVPCEIHWIITSAWTFPDPLHSRLLTPLTRWFFHRLSQVYGFSQMPPMPPDPSAVAERARSVRQILSFARGSPHAVIGLAPEGQDSPGGVLQMPPPGAGRFIHQLARSGFPIVPVAVFESDESEASLCLRFGPEYCLDTAGYSTQGRIDTMVSQVVMQRIAVLLPDELQGDIMNERHHKG